MESNRRQSIDENNYSLAKLCVLTIRQFLESTSLHGFKYLVQPGRSVYEKLFWYIVQFIGMITTVYIFVHALEGFSAKPTFTSLHSVKHPVWEIPFPAVSVCSVNKISRKAAMEYAIELSRKTTNHTVESLFKNIRYLGRLYDFELDEFDEYVKFQELLDAIDFNNETKVYDSQAVFEMKISPKCEDIMLRCQWGDTETNCSELFKYRKTRDGYCCVFNYVRPFGTLSDENVEKPLRSGFTGPNAGLIFILNATQSDYYYPIRNTLGFNILVFNPSDFPDNQNGGLRQVFVNPDTETFFKLDATTVESTTDVLQYSPEQRGCLFEHELPEQYAGHYSYVDCLLKCKLRSIISLCGCAPFFWPTNFPDGTTSKVKCTLAHNVCLDRYKGTINTFWPRNTEDNKDKKFAEDSIECPDCFPICTKTDFRITATYSKLLETAMVNSPWSLLQNLSSFTDISIVHVYYPFVATTLYSTDVVMTWQEIVSSFGGLLGLCLGFSLISIAEFVYFATVRLYQNIPVVFKLVLKSATQSPKLKTKIDRPETFSERIKEMYVNDFATYHYKLDKKRF